MPNAPIAVVTGASRGIGEAIALRFAKEGYQVFAIARSKAAPRPGIVALTADVSRPADVLQACAEILKVGTPAVLVNNAGIARSAPLAKTTLEEFEEMLAINTTAPFLFCKELIPAMVAAKTGRVINIASTAALKGYKYTSAYCASKHALLGLTRALAIELGRTGVTVNAVCPGWTDTDMLAASAQAVSKATGRSTDESRQVLAAMNPMHRLIRPEEVADLCWFLAGPQAASISGAAYPVDAAETA